jgi:glycosyltransferase involved in cell wall biosynthesis
VDDLSVLKPIASQIDIRPSVSAADLVSAYREADLFVLPSVAEGFGQVLLEALACGVPVLSTHHTAAPDLVDEGVQGFVVEPRRADLLAERIEWALCHRAALAEMRVAARARAERFHWNKFGENVVQAILNFPAEAKDNSREALAQHV